MLDVLQLEQERIPAALLILSMSLQHLFIRHYPVLSRLVFLNVHSHSFCPNCLDYSYLMMIHLRKTSWIQYSISSILTLAVSPLCYNKALDQVDTFEGGILAG